jgi:hypothetical protein
VAAAQEAGGGRSQWDGVLPTRTLLVEWPAGQDTPTGYRISNLPATTPVTDLVRWAKTHRRIEHGCREFEHGLGLDHFEGRAWRGWHHPSRTCRGAGPAPAPPADDRHPPDEPATDRPEPNEVLLEPVRRILQPVTVFP